MIKVVPTSRAGRGKGVILKSGQIYQDTIFGFGVHIPLTVYHKPSNHIIQLFIFYLLLSQDHNINFTVIECRNSVCRYCYRNPLVCSGNIYFWRIRDIDLSYRSISQGGGGRYNMLASVTSNSHKLIMHR